MAVLTIDLDIETLDKGARGVARRHGKVLFIDGALPAERVRAVIERDKDSHAFGRVQDVLRPSPFRVSPPCPHFGVCGGCALQHADGAAQVALKQRELEDALGRKAGLGPLQVLPPLHGPQWAYRHRARLAVRFVPTRGGVLLGFHERKSSFVADIHVCHVLPRPVSDLLEPLHGLIASLSIPHRIPQIEVAVGELRREAHGGAGGRDGRSPYVERDEPRAECVEPCVESGELCVETGELCVETGEPCVENGEPCVEGIEPCSESGGEPHAIVLVLRHLLPLAEADLDTLRAFALRHKVAWWLQPGGPDTAAPLDAGRLDVLAYGLPRFGLHMRFRPTDFIQANVQANRALVSRALDLLRAGPEDRVLDLFCGLGNFTLPLATQVREVVGVEGSEALLARARRGAREHGLAARTRFACTDLFHVDVRWLRGQGAFDAILLDPPREGARAVSEALAALDVFERPRRIVYVSCNPLTLARDAAILAHQGGYRLVAAGVVNMFPQTSHVESVSVFE